jgi:hypothetical protein
MSELELWKGGSLSRQQRQINRRGTEIRAEEGLEFYKRAERMAQGKQLAELGMQLSGELDRMATDAGADNHAQEITARRYKEAFDNAAIGQIYRYMNRP